jgi:accessory colonization factor AcfC
MSGEIATPVIREMVCAICWPGTFLFDGAAVVATSARAVNKDIVRQKTTRTSQLIFIRANCRIFVGCKVRAGS